MILRSSSMQEKQMERGRISYWERIYPYRHDAMKRILHSVRISRNFLWQTVISFHSYIYRKSDRKDRLPYLRYFPVYGHWHFHKIYPNHHHYQDNVPYRPSNSYPITLQIYVGMLMYLRECFAAFFHILSFLWIYVAMRSKYQKECKNHERYFPCSSHTILWLKAYSW